MSFEKKKKSRLSLTLSLNYITPLSKLYLEREFSFNKLGFINGYLKAIILNAELSQLV